MRAPIPGQRLEWTRTISEDDIRRFTEISGDAGRHHVEKDAEGRLLAQGLLTATLPTKLGGDLHYIAKTMLFEFVKPVWAGDALRCTGTIEKVEERPMRWRLEMSFSVSNQKDEVVLKGTTTGHILR